MPRRRYISTMMSLDRSIAKLDDLTALVYTWLIPHADDYAVLPSADPAVLQALVMPLRAVDNAEFSTAIHKLIDSGHLKSKDGCLWIPVDKFYRYQTYISASKQVEGRNAEQRRESPPNTSIPSPTPSPTPRRPYGYADKRRETPQGNRPAPCGYCAGTGTVLSGADSGEPCPQCAGTGQLKAVPA